jgi:anti-sigma regulatory factor (Ser/Thr protein kinase)
MSYFPISHIDQIGEARREGLALADRLGFSDHQAGKVALAITEAGTNLIKHAGGGEIFLGPAPGDQVEMVAVDRGPGIANTAECLRDGYSTSGGPGTGLGALARISSLFDFYSMPGAGTAILARLSAGRKGGGLSPARLEVGAMVSPIAGEEVSGDAWALKQDVRGAMILVADGLGHGTEAAEASSDAVRTFQAAEMPRTLDHLDRIHHALAKTRGAAVLIVDVDLDRGVMRFCGVGNISGQLLGGPSPRRLHCTNGIAGHQIRTVQEFNYPWPDDGLLILYSDGIQSGLSMEKYAGLYGRHPSLIAAVLHRDFNRKTDDATVVVARRSGP